MDLNRPEFDKPPEHFQVHFWWSKMTTRNEMSSSRTLVQTCVGYWGVRLIFHEPEGGVNTFFKGL